MAELVIKGHATRGKEVIEILEMLGGINTYACKAVRETCFYFIVEGEIDYDEERYITDEYTIFTLEEFLEKFPYKVGDKVKVCGNDLGVIISMRWEIEYVVYRVKLNKNGYETSKTSENLQPYEETPLYLNEKANKQAEEIAEILKPAKEIMEERKYSELRMPLDDDDKLATEATIEGNKITPPENYLIGKITKVDNGMIVEFVKKQPQYPKTYDECCKVLLLKPERAIYSVSGLEYKRNLIVNLQRLLICRDAYWKIAGEQMGLGEPWKPDWLNTEQDKFVLYTHNDVICLNRFLLWHNVLAFPTAEIRDAFVENFREQIEPCKELL